MRAAGRYNDIKGAFCNAPTVSLKEILRIMPAEKFFYFGKLVFFSGFRLDICIANRKELHYNKLTAPYLPRNRK